MTKFKTPCIISILDFSKEKQVFGQVAQLVEQRIENPRVGSSILPQATRIDTAHSDVSRFYLGEMRQNMRRRLIGMIKPLRREVVLCFHDSGSIVYSTPMRC